MTDTRKFDSDKTYREKEMKNKITVRSVTFAYTAFIEPRAMVQGAEPRYSCCILIPKDETSSFEALRNLAIDIAKNANSGELPSGIDLGIRDGSEKDPVTGEYKKRHPVFHNAYYINAKTKFAPTVICGKDKKPLSDMPGLEPDGMQGDVALSPFAYSHTGNKGVSWGLQAVWLKRKGTPISSSAGVSAFEKDTGGDCDELDPPGSAAEDLASILS